MQIQELLNKHVPTIKTIGTLSSWIFSFCLFIITTILSNKDDSITTIAKIIIYTMASIIPLTTIAVLIYYKLYLKEKTIYNGLLAVKSGIILLAMPITDINKIEIDSINAALTGNFDKEKIKESFLHRKIDLYKRSIEKDQYHIIKADYKTYNYNILSKEIKSIKVINLKERIQ